MKLYIGDIGFAITRYHRNAGGTIKDAFDSSDEVYSFSYFTDQTNFDIYSRRCFMGERDDLDELIDRINEDYFFYLMAVKSLVDPIRPELGYLADPKTFH